MKTVYYAEEAREDYSMSKSGKGSSFERDICRQLSLWWSNGKRDDLFWRCAGSGAMAKTRSKIGKQTFGQYGDVQATDPAGQPLLNVFTIEIKRGYSSANFINMLDKPGNAAIQTWELFYNQVTQDATNAKSRAWMIIWRRDRKQTLVFLPMGIMTSLWNMYITAKFPHIRAKVLLKNGKPVRVFVCTLNDFLEYVQPCHVESLL